MTAIEEPATYQVALSFEDGVTRFINCREDQTVADASYRQRINIPLDCRDGACGTCKALCESGTYDGGIYIEDALSADEAEAGYMLPCVTKPSSDLVLQIPSTSEVAKTQAASYTGTIVYLERLSPTTVDMGIEIPNRDELAFLPGQYVNISVPGSSVTRSYSFSNGTDEKVLTFLVKLTPGGVMSEYLDKQAAVGDQITFSGPHGSFFLREAERPVVMLAGGTGLAPMLSMLRTMQTQGSDRKTHLIFGVSTDADVVALEELRRFAAEVPSFSWDYCVADPSSAAPNKGFVTALLGPEHLNGGDVAIYLCGPPPMVEAVRTSLADNGIKPTGFFYEKFALAVPSAAVEIESFVGSAQGEPLLQRPDARSIAGQVVLPETELLTLTGVSPRSEDVDTVRRIAGQLVAAAFDAQGPSRSVGDSGTVLLGGSRGIAGQEIFPQVDLAQAVAASVASETAALQTAGAVPAVPAAAVADDGYQIGEEHPAVHESDALFEARSALELGALELTIGRLNNQQLTGYRLLAEATLPYVDGDRFVDAAEYTETNAAFHDYLFTLTGNQHLLQAYTALGVKGRMSEVLRNATWCDPLCAKDHVDIVEAFERDDRDAARDLIVAHADRSKVTMRRAMADARKANRPMFITPGRFAGKVVVVTGAAQGIGEQTARRISAEGGTLLLVDRSELVKELADGLTSDGGTAVAVTADLENWAGAESVAQQAISAFGRIDVLINNVGGAINFKPFTAFTDAEIRAELDRSLMTTLYMCRAALPSMVAQGRGVIVNVSSAATRGINRIPYSAAKGGVNAITASLAMEYADDGIRVVATAPGGTEAPPRRVPRGTPEATSDLEREWQRAHVDQTLASSLMKRYGTLDEQAAAICFLASDEASYITGTVLPVSGGDQG